MAITFFLDPIVFILILLVKICRFFSFITHQRIEKEMLCNRHTETYFSPTKRFGQFYKLHTRLPKISTIIINGDIVHIETLWIMSPRKQLSFNLLSSEKLQKSNPKICVLSQITIIFQLFEKKVKFNVFLYFFAFNHSTKKL